MSPKQEIESEVNRISKQLSELCKKRMKFFNWSQRKIAEETGKMPSTICDMLNGRENSTLKSIITVFYYLGYQVTITIKPYKFRGYTPEKVMSKKQK